MWGNLTQKPLRFNYGTGRMTNMNNKIKKLNAILSILFLSLTLFSTLLIAADTKEKRTRYFSPNSDGKLDEFVIPLKITDKRYIMSWSLTIENEAGEVVRTIGNKIALPTSLTFVTFFKQLGAVKKGIAVPSSVTWNGAMDNGETAPDGMYYYYFTAIDDNKNEQVTEKYPVIIDTTPPEVEVSSSSDKIFGEGAKMDFKISQVGSIEDNWTGVIKNSNGQVVKTFNWTNDSPQDFKWKGDNDEGLQVADGVYSYEISAKDKAENYSAPASITNIIYSSQKPSTSITLASSKYFSPSTTSPNTHIALDTDIPLPEESSGNKLVSWSIKIIDAKGKVYKTYNEKDSAEPPLELLFDGKDDKGNLLPVGVYQAQVNASYLNGYDTPASYSPEFILDTISPNASLSVTDKVFGGSAKPKTTIIVSTDNHKKLAPITSWKVRIFNTKDESISVNEYEYGEYPPINIDWDGFNSNGERCEDGEYKAQITGQDLAGNSSTTTSAQSFTLNTQGAMILLSMTESAFSPNKDGVKDSITFTPYVKDADNVSDYTFTIKDNADKVIRTIANSTTLPKNFIWDGVTDSGEVAKDGEYSAAISINTINGSSGETQTASFILDTTPPALNATPSYLVFSPDGDSNKDAIAVNVTDCTREDLWQALVKNEKGQVVRTYSWQDLVKTEGTDGFTWDGKSDMGNTCPDGKYTISLASTDAAGNSFNFNIDNITLDNREIKAYLTAELDAFSPNGDGNFDTQTIKTTLNIKDGITDWILKIMDKENKLVKTLSSSSSSEPPSSIEWDGKDDKGTLCEGEYKASLSLSYEKGNKVDAASSLFICTTIPPKLAVTTKPKYFSPDNDGTDDDMFITLKAESKVPFKAWSFDIKDPKSNLFWTTKGNSSIKSMITWDGLSNIQKDVKTKKAERVQSASDYPYTFTVRDSQGMTSILNGIITVDILVIREGNLLKMAVPSIIFRSDNADFKTSEEVKNGIDPEIAKNNERVLKRIAEVLNKFREYKVTIVGHANRVTDNDKEETESNPALWGPALIPLSHERAEFVKTYLKKKGVSGGRLSTEGKGGTQLIVDYKDKDNNWKNRRVEFILQK